MQQSEYIYSEEPAIELFQKMRYTYCKGNELEERNDITEVLLKERLRSAIKRINPWINENNLEKAFREKINQRKEKIIRFILEEL